MDLRVLDRSHINFSQWDRCVQSSPTQLPYGLSWYLDAATNRQWKGIVDRDYQKVMPLPIKNFRLWKHIIQPPLSQQLGVFGRGVSENDVHEMLQNIPSKYPIAHIPMNENVPKTDLEGWQRKTLPNYTIDLSKPYKELRKAYTKSLKHRTNKFGTKLKVKPYHNVKQLQRNFHEITGKRIGISQSHLNRSSNILHAAIENESGFMLEVTTVDDQWAGQLFYLRSKNRLIQIKAVANDLGRNLCALHVGIDHVLKTHAGQELTYDFEGSKVPGVATFFQSFGAELTTYNHYTKKSLLQLILDKFYARIR
jgi:uncharacterized protein involved in tellurium resistance